VNKANNPPLRRAVFLDRDGTLIEDRGHLRNPEDVVFYPDTFRSLLFLKRDYLFFIVTHQSGLGKGILTDKEVESVNRFVVEELARRDIPIQDVYVCPHESGANCECIKPRPFFLQEASRKHGIDLRASFVVGDHPHDVHLAWNANARGIYVLTGHGEKHRKELTGKEPVVRNLYEAALWILACGRDF